MCFDEVTCGTRDLLAQADSTIRYTINWAVQEKKSWSPAITCRRIFLKPPPRSPRSTIRTLRNSLILQIQGSVQSKQVFPTSLAPASLLGDRQLRRNRRFLP